MARSPRDRYIAERDRVSDVADDRVRAALLSFADALDPEVPHASTPDVTNGRVSGHSSASNSTAKAYVSCLRAAHARGLPVLEADAETVNAFMSDLVTPPEERRTGMVDYDGSISRGTAGTWQAALRSFYRWATEPGAPGDRPDVAVDWPADDIRTFSSDSQAVDTETLPDGDDLDAMREACLASMNTRRDRAFLELAAGTGQRVYALVTLRVGDINLDADTPHILLNPAIDGDGDKGAIATAGRWRPIVTDVGPIREWLSHHPLRDAETRADVGAPDAFEECYAFVGDPTARRTDLTSHWGISAANDMLTRRKDHTRRNDGLATVTADVNPHAWRHLAYTKSQDVPELDEPTRRKVFGWQPGSDTGEELYGHESGKKAGERFAALWQDHYGEADVEGVAEAVVGNAAAADLPPETTRAIAEALVADEQAKRRLSEGIRSSGE